MGDNAKGFEFQKFATPRIIGGIAIAVIILWALSIIFTASRGPSHTEHADKHASPTVTTHTDTDSHEPAEAEHASAVHRTTDDHTAGETDAASHGESADSSSHGTPVVEDNSGTHMAATHATRAAADDGDHTPTTAHSEPSAAAHQPAERQQPAHQQPAAADQHSPSSDSHATAAPAADPHRPATEGHPITAGAPAHKPKPKGVAFVEAAIQPLNYELEERWWGWRANDLIDLTDNVNNFQMGVLEVTRRTTVALAERISRTGTTDAFDENLEQAMNWFMVKATSYWFPSAESKYREGLEELQAYQDKLMQGRATFYTRTDNLIPLLASFEDLLGSCDENLVKEVNEDGTPVSAFMVDNYFFYTQGVASSMAVVLEAVHHDFLLTLEQRNGTELLHHAIVSCQRAAAIEPWIILDRDLGSIFANHRANLAAPISHARFYLGQLIKTLST